MRLDVAEKWIDALLSGQYCQTEGQLQKKDGYCCLGVLCDLHAQETKEGEWSPTDIYSNLDEASYEYIPFGSSGDALVLPPAVATWAGLKDRSGRLELRDEDNPDEVTISNLAELNDDGRSFAEIAEIIRENVEAL